MLNKPGFTKENIIKISTYIYDSIRQDIRVKMVIFFIGLVLWFNITSRKEFEKDFDIDIKLFNIKATRTVSNTIETKARIKVKSTGQALAFSNYEKNLYFYLDLKGVDKRKSFKLNELNFRNTTSSELEFAVIYPRNIEIILDSLATKKIPISFNSTFSLAPGYVKTGSFSLFPDSIQITGPLKKISKIKLLNTVVENVKDLTSDYRVNLPLLLSSSDIIKYSHKEVRALQKIVRKGTNNYKVWIDIKNKPKNFDFTIDPVYLDIEVTGPVNELLMISNKDFTISVDYKKYNKDKKTIKINAKSDIDLQWSTSDDFVNVIEI